MLFYKFLPLCRFFLTMSHTALFTRIKWFLILLLLMILDISPIPVLGLIAIYILVSRPLWFKDGVEEIYGIKPNIDKKPES